MQFLQIQFYVAKIDKTGGKSFDDVFKCLKSLKGIRSIELLNHNVLVIDSNVPSSILQEKIESAGCITKLKKYGG